LYELVPAGWLTVNKNDVWFPHEYTRCRLEKAVEEDISPKPKNDFRKYSVNLLHATGVVYEHLKCSAVKVTCSGYNLTCGFADDFDEGLDFVRELDGTDATVEEVCDAIALKRASSKSVASSRGKRSCKPSARAAEAAALPSSSSAAEWDDAGQT
jgi:hypothetical protein